MRIEYKRLTKVNKVANHLTTKSCLKLDTTHSRQQQFTHNLVEYVLLSCHKSKRELKYFVCYKILILNKVRLVTECHFCSLGNRGKFAGFSRPRGGGLNGRKIRGVVAERSKILVILRNTSLDPFLRTRTQ